MGSDSEDSHQRPEKQAEPEATPAPEGAVIAEAATEDADVECLGKDSVERSGKDGEDDGDDKMEAEEPTGNDESAGKQGDEPDDGEKAKPSYTLHLRNLPPDMEEEELSMRLERFGKVISIERGADVTVAKFSRTNDAYEAREKLNGSTVEGCTLQVEFGPQDPEHYERGKNRAAQAAQAAHGDAVRRVFLDGDDAAGEGAAEDGGKEGAGKEADGGKEDAAMDDAAAGGEPGRAPGKAGAATTRGPGGAAHELVRPPNPASRWSEKLKFEEQLEDYMKMNRRGMYNRYLVIGKLPPQLRTEMAIWHMAAPVQRDVLRVEMLTCFGKPVAHVALRSATAAATMHRITEQLHPNLTVAFAPPRKTASTLWLGNVDDFVQRKELEALLSEYGKLVGGLRYIPARTCAFVHFEEASAAVAARNALYALEVQRNQYLNVDFVDESERVMSGPDGQEGWAAMGGPWHAARGQGPGPPGPPWGPPAPWGPPGPFLGPGGPDWWRHQGPGRGGKGGRSPPRPADWGRGDRGDRGGDRRRSRSRSRRRSGSRQRGRDGSASEGRGGCKRELGQAKVQSRVKLFKMGEFCCNIVANAVKGGDTNEPLLQKLQIDQRTKVDHCRSHMDKAGVLAAIWHFSAADRRDCAAYDALCDYFVEKQRVGLVQTPSYYIYIVPPTEKYLKELKLPLSNYVVGIQIPVKK